MKKQLCEIQIRNNSNFKTYLDGKINTRGEKMYAIIIFKKLQMILYGTRIKNKIDELYTSLNKYCSTFKHHKDKNQE